MTLPLFPQDRGPSKHDAKRHLDRISPMLRDCVLDAFDVAKAAGAAHPLMAGAFDYMQTREKLMNSLVVASVRSEFASVADIEMKDENGFLELIVDAEFDLRFRHASGTGRSHNSETAAQKRYRNQLPMFGEAILDVVRLTVGWRWDVAATRITEIVVVFVKGDHPVWQYSILDQAEDEDEDDGLSIRRPVSPNDSDDSEAATRYHSAIVKKDSENEE